MAQVNIANIIFTLWCLKQSKLLDNF